MNLTLTVLRGLLALCALVSLTACDTPRLVVRSELVEVPVRQYVPVPTQLTEPVADPAKPSPECVASGKPVLCNRQLIDWRDSTASALSEANARLQSVRKMSASAAEGDE